MLECQSQWLPVKLPALKKKRVLTGASGEVPMTLVRGIGMMIEIKSSGNIGEMNYWGGYTSLCFIGTEGPVT